MGAETLLLASDCWLRSMMFFVVTLEIFDMPSAPPPPTLVPLFTAQSHRHKRNERDDNTTTIIASISSLSPQNNAHPRKERCGVRRAFMVDCRGMSLFRVLYHPCYHTCCIL
jgi:hypothetical protein